MLLIRTRRTLKYSLMVLAAALTTGALYSIQSTEVASAAENEAPVSFPAVEAVTLEFSPLRDWNTFSGRLKAVDEAVIRPLVGGTIQQVLFTDGALVEAGQTLFIIDPRPYEATLNHARASLASAEADVALAKIEFDRASGLADNNVISQSIRDNRENDLAVAQARLESARADVATAELNVEYAYVKAPFAGRVGRAEVTAGNVIQGGANAPALTYLIGADKLYAEFDVDEATYFNVVRSAALSPASGERTVASVIPVEILLGNNEERVYQGTLHAFDNQLDIRSGTIRARAVLENMDHQLIPGIFASVRLGTAAAKPTLLVPERAIGVSQDKRFVYVVNADDRVEYREVTLGRSVEGGRVIDSGLTRGERVITNGVQRVTSDMQVTVTTL